MRRPLCAVLLLGLCGAVQAALPGPLQQFIAGLTTFSADFEQSVQDAQGKPVSAGRGRLWVQRPGQFRWDYRPSDAAADDAMAGQLLVADGRSLWLYERDLAQVTVREAGALETNAPMLLLSGDAAQIENAFTLTTAPAHEGLQWVEVRPRSGSAEFESAELGFRGTNLERMIVGDRLEQHTVLRIMHGQRNPRLDAALFRFEPPAGVDVIGTPQK